MASHESLEIDARSEILPVESDDQLPPPAWYATFLNRLDDFDFANRRTTADGYPIVGATTDDDAPAERRRIKVHPSRIVTGMHWFLRCELMECTFHFVFGTWFMFFCLRMPLSEIRERLTGWLTLIIALSGCRCVIITMIMEELKWLQEAQRNFDIRMPLVMLIQSSKLSVSRWLHILDVLWWCISYQLLTLYKRYTVIMKPLANGQELLPTSFVLQRSGGRPLITLDPVETETIAILRLISKFAMASLFGYLVVFILYTTFFALKATTTFSGWISLMSPPSLVRLPPLGARTSRVQSVPPRCLESFPTLVWQTDWKVRSVEDLKHSTSSSMCLVCLQSYAQDETLRVLPCAHAFHAACIDEWLATHVECPIRCQVTLTEPFEGRFDEAVLERNLPPQAIESLRNVEYLHSAA